jgi:peroxiredoxin Q/BCP
MLGPGDTAPDFVETDQHGNEVSLDALLEAGELILYFYPADFSPVCTAEACAFRDGFAGVQDVGVQVVGVSPQSGATHRRFSDAFSLPFPLLSDPRKRLIKAFGVDGPFGFGVRRVTFLIDRSKVIRQRIVSDLFVGSHVDLLKQTLASHAGGARDT